MQLDKAYFEHDQSSFLTANTDNSKLATELAKMSLFLIFHDKHHCSGLEMDWASNPTEVQLNHAHAQTSSHTTPSPLPSLSFAGNRCTFERQVRIVPS